ncbi:helix-turn-helix transcriptional regulator [Staphylococcus muscae]|uniref:Putative DNA binding protein n=1 Tax=Staphylococcus muscae TaxID=1294 RepID=A0A240C936_9STAP|nr:helix-turn-helix transcriptional regulator [Staphylococcus muscae]GGA87216.1 transcriptional regulator [Staphylococcus muscae]SNW04082.1 putative DNA binding protein [Staphylococcus muscae]
MTQVNRVKAYRVAKGVSQLELARRVGVSRQTINMIENDKYNPTLNLCIRIAETLDVTLNDLFWGEK